MAYNAKVISYSHFKHMSTIDVLLVFYVDCNKIFLFVLNPSFSHSSRGLVMTLVLLCPFNHISSFETGAGRPFPFLCQHKRHGETWTWKMRGRARSLYVNTSARSRSSFLSSWRWRQGWVRWRGGLTWPLLSYFLAQSAEYQDHLHFYQAPFHTI